MRREFPYGTDFEPLILVKTAITLALGNFLFHVRILHILNTLSYNFSRQRNGKQQKINPNGTQPRMIVKENELLVVRMLMQYHLTTRQIFQQLVINQMQRNLQLRFLSHHRLLEPEPFQVEIRLKLLPHMLKEQHPFMATILSRKQKKLRNKRANGYQPQIAMKI